MLKEFREFAMKGNMLDLAVGVIIGAAFGTIIDVLVKGIIMPPIGLVLGKVDFANLFLVLKEGTTPGPYASLDAASKAGAVTLNWGQFVNALVSFVIVAFCVFLVVKSMNKLRREQPATPAMPPEPSDEAKLLTEIRDLMKAK